MAQSLKVPQMGESVVEGTVNKWFVEVGEPIKKDQPIVELLTDKVNVEVPAETDGVLLEIKAKVGDIVPVGKEIAIIGKLGEKPEKAEPVSEGKADRKEEEAKTEKKIEKEKKQEATPAQKAEKAPATPKPTAEPQDLSRMRLSPAVRRLIKEHGVDVTRLTGTGSGGRVTKKDVEDYISGAAAPASGVSAETMRQPSTPSTALEGGERTEEIPLTHVRKLIAQHMVKSKQTSPHVTTFDECDFTRLVEFRKRVNPQIEEEHGIRLTYMPFIAYAACKAIRKYPFINSQMTEDKVIVKHFVNLGFAVARKSGLIVPVVKDAHRMSIIELAKAMKDLGERARDEKLKPTEIEAGTITLTNAGVYGAVNSTPIISQPQVAIVGIHAIKKRPWVVDDEIQIRDIMQLGMSFDHRLIDGHYAVQYLRTLITYIEEPEMMLL